MSEDFGQKIRECNNNNNASIFPHFLTVGKSISDIEFYINYNKSVPYDD